MKLELKHLVGYLPYNVTFYVNKRTYVLTSDVIARREANRKLENIKPILHPLTDLTKEIEIGGKKFVPITRLRPDSFNSEGKFSYDYYKQARVFILKNNDTGEELHIYTTNFISVSTRKHIFNVSDYRIIQKLYEWHFDVFGLIESGLAIDINTL